MRLLEKKFAFKPVPQPTNQVFGAFVTSEPLRINSLRDRSNAEPDSQRVLDMRISNFFQFRGTIMRHLCCKSVASGPIARGVGSEHGSYVSGSDLAGRKITYYYASGKHTFESGSVD